MKVIQEHDGKYIIKLEEDNIFEDLNEDIDKPTCQLYKINKDEGTVMREVIYGVFILCTL